MKQLARVTRSRAGIDQITDIRIPCRNHPVKGRNDPLVTLHRSRPWSMTEVFLLGALVAIVKLSGWVHVTPGVGIWGLASLTILLTILSLVEPKSWWSLLQIPA